MPAPHSTCAPSAQADLTFATELFLLGSPAASPVEGESLHEIMCDVPVFAQKWMGGHADTQPNAVVDFYE